VRLPGPDRPGGGDRPRPRRTAARAPQEPGSQLGPEARGPAAVVYDDRVDDVERARLGAAAALLDRDARRRPRVAGPARAVAARRATAPDRDGCQSALPDGLPQGRAGARLRARPELDPPAVHRRVAAAGRGLPVRVRAA